MVVVNLVKLQKSYSALETCFLWEIILNFIRSKLLDTTVSTSIFTTKFHVMQRLKIKSKVALYHQ